VHVKTDKYDVLQNYHLRAYIAGKTDYIVALDFTVVWYIQKALLSILLPLLLLGSFHGLEHRGQPIQPLQKLM